VGLHADPDADAAPPASTLVLGRGDGGPDEELATARVRELAALREQERRVPLGSVLALSAIWAVLFAMSLIRGGHGAASLVGIACGSAVYWTVVAASVPLVGGALALISLWLLRQYRRRKAVSMAYVEGDIVWNVRGIVLYPLASLTAGLASGLLGIGGGMVQSPLMLEMGMLPQVAAATASYMIVSDLTALWLSLSLFHCVCCCGGP
jgi:uncharacterized membrane protein YfcA